MNKGVWTEEWATATETISNETIQRALGDMVRAGYEIELQKQKGEKSMDKSWKDSEAKKRWDKENTVRYSLKLNKKNDADILAQVERAGTAQKALKNAVRAGMKRDATLDLLERKPELAELIREAAKLSAEQLQTVKKCVDRINSGHDVREVLLVTE